MPLFKSRDQKEREEHNRAMLDETHATHGENLRGQGAYGTDTTGGYHHDATMASAPGDHHGQTYQHETHGSTGAGGIPGHAEKYPPPIAHGGLGNTSGHGTASMAPGGTGGLSGHGKHPNTGYNDHSALRGTSGAHHDYTSSGIPPPAAINRDTTSSHGSGSLTGKVEAAIGSVVGSQSLKAKGLQKQYEAEAFQRQSAELGEAERLENEARVRRERAVAHGAHPENLQQGAGLQQSHGQGQNFNSGGNTGIF